MFNLDRINKRHRRMLRGSELSPGSEAYNAACRAFSAARDSLAREGLRATLLAGLDEAGLKVEVSPASGEASATRAWFHGFGRSFGPVRIFLVAGDER